MSDRGSSWALLSVVALRVSASAAREHEWRHGDRSGHHHLVAQRQQGPGKAFWQTVADDYTAPAPGRHRRGRAAPERAVPDQDPGRAAVGRPARPLPAVGRRRAGRPGEGRQGHGHHRRDARRGSSRPRRLGRRLAGRRQAVRHPLHASASSGFWYNKALFEQAGITRRRGRGRAPRGGREAEGGGHHPDRARRKDRWPSAFCWDYLAVRYCSQQTLQQAQRQLQVHRPLLGQGRRGAPAADRRRAVPEGLPRHARAAGRGELGRPGRERQGGDGAHGPLEPERDERADPEQEGPRQRPRLVPVPGRRRRRGQGRRRRSAAATASRARAKAPPAVRRLPQVHRQRPVQRSWGKLSIGLPVAKGSESSSSPTRT